MGDEPKVLCVKSARADDRVVLWEVDDTHPEGEAWIAGAAPALVGETGTVAKMLKEGTILECNAQERALAEKRREMARLSEFAPVQLAAQLPDPELAKELNALRTELKELREKVEAKAAAAAEAPKK